MLFHAIGGRDELAAHLRVLYGLPSGSEGVAATLTGNLSWVAQLSILAAIVLLMADRRGKRAAARAKAEGAAKTAPGTAAGKPRPAP